MKIEGLYLDGFGLFSKREIGPLTQTSTVNISRDPILFFLLFALELIEAECEYAPENVRCSLTRQSVKHCVPVQGSTVNSCDTRFAARPAEAFDYVRSASVINQGDSAPVPPSSDGRVEPSELGREAEQDGPDEGQQGAFTRLVEAIDDGEGARR